MLISEEFTAVEMGWVSILGSAILASRFWVLMGEVEIYTCGTNLSVPMVNASSNKMHFHSTTKQYT